MSTTKQKGDKGEKMARDYLEKNNYIILDKNFKYGRIGEIDIIVKKEDKIIFIEVKYRENKNFGEPEESITKSKKEKLKLSIDYYLQERNLDFENISFDVIAISKGEKSYTLKHYKNLEL